MLKSTVAQTSPARKGGPSTVAQTSPAGKGGPSSVAQTSPARKGATFIRNFSFICFPSG